MSEEQRADEQPEVMRPEYGNRPFLEAVRRAAGWRVSPRQVAAALNAIADGEDEPTPERVAEVAAAARGDTSTRQRRHGELWRALGAQLIVQGQPGDPAAQRAFVGTARTAARRTVSDALLINVALELAAEGRPLEPVLTGHVARELRSRLGAEATPDEIADALPDALRAVRQRRKAARARSRSQIPMPRQRRRVAPPSRRR